MSFQIEIKASALKELTELPPSIRIRVSNHIDALAKDPKPFGYRKLAGTMRAYRIRVGMYRVVYEVHDDKLVVLIIRIAHRREVYR